MGKLSDDQQSGVYAADIVCSCASLLGSLFVIIMYLGYKEIRSFSFRLVVYLSIFDSMYAIGILIGPTQSYTACMAQAIIVSYFPLGTIVWTNIIAFTLYKSIIQQIDMQKYEWKIILFGILAPLPGTLLPLTTNSYGKARFGECWIVIDDDRTNGIVWQLFQFYLPLWLGFIFNASCYYKVRHFVKVMMMHVQNDLDDAVKQQKLKLISRLKYYPLALIFCWFFATIDQIYLYSNYDDPSFGLALLDVSFGSSQGLLNALIYGLNPVVMNAFMKSLHQCMPCVSYEDKGREMEIATKV
ncbi:unnamed protein product [Blepharisma stoltei]|uniref:G-protein coupled receptors family 2 profile 2 domain-containing protein n=1 Tax=Blepharisma stoltei TaxID=1481888 RepID=A0AAU9KBQ7_9CILI|nr:unnamed protein product [Blepharisma stoltei]